MSWIQRFLQVWGLPPSTIANDFMLLHFAQNLFETNSSWEILSSLIRKISMTSLDLFAWAKIPIARAISSSHADSVGIESTSIARVRQGEFLTTQLSDDVKLQGKTLPCQVTVSWATCPN